MNKIIVIALFLVVSTVGFSQKKKHKQCVFPDNTEELYGIQLKVYKASVKYGDFETATKAIYEMIAIKPEMKVWKDTLALLYYQTGNYPSSLLVSKDILKEKPESKDILYIKASSEKNLGLLKDALADFESYHKTTPELEVKYEIATIQYQLKRYGELDMTIGDMIRDTAINSKTVTIQVEQGQQNVNMLAAVINMKGVLYKELGKVEESLKYFRKAVEIQPNFYLARQNISILEAEMKKNQEDKGN